jgi:hypothetical protein
METFFLLRVYLIFEMLKTFFPSEFEPLFLFIVLFLILKHKSLFFIRGF